MYFGQPFGAFGDPDFHVQDMAIESTASGVRVSILASPGLGNAYYQIYVNNVFAGCIYCPEGEYSETLTLSLPSASEYQITTFRIGPNSTIDQSSFARVYEEGSSSVTANWSWDYEIIGTADSEFFSSWSVSGLSVSRVLPADKNTRGNVPVSMTVSGGVATINLGILAQGSGAVGGSITLTEINSSGVSGSVTVDGSATTEDSTLSIRWPRSMSILRDITSPPTTQVASIGFNSVDAGSYTETVDVGTYYYAFQAVSDTDDIGDASAPQTVTVSGAPEKPTDIEYTSGNAAATVIGWTVSETAGATYNIYVQNIDDPYLDTSTPTQTEPAGSTSTTLAAITGFPGVARVVVRAELAGAEEKNLDTLTLEYDTSGNIISARPNVPTISGISVSDGLTAGVSVLYDPENEDASPSTVDLYTRAIDGSYNFTSSDASASISEGVDGIKRSTVSFAFSTPGWYYCTVKAKTTGGQECSGYAPEVAVYVSDTNLSAPTGTFEATRG